MTSTYNSKIIWGLMLGLATSFGCSDEMELDAVTPTSPEEAGAANSLAGNTLNQKVKLKSNNYIIISNTSLPTDLNNQLRSLNAELTGNMNEVGIATATSSDPNFAAKASRIQGVNSVVRDLEIEWYDPSTEKIFEFNEEAYGNPPFSGDNDRYFDLQWGHDAVNAPEAWNAGARGKGVRVAVLDSGFDLDHLDLAPNIDMAASKSFVVGEPLNYRLPGVGSHGTHTAGTIAAADNGLGIIGVAPEAQLILVKVLRDSGSGSFSWMLQGILHAVEQGADVINLSLGASLPRNGIYLNEDGKVVSDTKATQELLNAISKVTNYARQQGVTVIASAGNDANNGNKDQSLVHIPSGAPNVISISATAPRGWALDPLNASLDHLASYSNYGTHDVHFAAPGGDYSYPGNELARVAGILQYVYVFDYVFSTGSNLDPNRASYYWSVGTSMAAPHATGVAALIIGKNGGEMSPAALEAAMRASADDLGKPGRDPYFGHGRVNAYKAILSVGNAQ